MLVRDIIHIPLIAMVQLAFTYVWNLKIRHRAFKTPAVWGLALFGSLFNVWGLDVIQRDFMVDTLREMILLSAGCWLVFVLATNAKYLAVYGWSKKDFWLDYGGELLAFLLSGILIYLAT